MYAGESDGGRIVIVEADGSVGATPILDLKAIYGADLIDNQNPTGLRSFAFHPDFYKPGADGEGKFYVVAMMSVGSAQAGVEIQDGPFTPIWHSTPTEWTVDPNDPDKIDPNSAREILRISEPNFHHNTEQLMFNPNAEVGDADYGMLYIAAGDGIVNPPGDPFMEVQNLDNPRGKILRLDLLEQSNGDAYGIPQDNPFLNEAGALPYIWATGLRHHQNLVFDTGGQGRMIFNNIGQKQVDEINIGVAGANYGWPLREGTFSQSPDGASHPVDNAGYTLPLNDASYNFIYPVAQFDRDEASEVNGISILSSVGGYVYRDDDAPDLFGKYLFGDIISGRVFYVSEDDLILGQQAEIKELKFDFEGVEQSFKDIIVAEVGGERVDLRFGQNEDGEVFILSKHKGKIYKLLPVDAGVGEDIRGTTASETIVGTAFDDKITAIDGDNIIMAAGGDDLIEWHGRQVGRDGNDIVDGGEGADTVRMNTHASLGDELRLGVVDDEAILSRINLDEFTITMTDVETVLINAKGGNDRLVVDNIEDVGVNFVDFRGGDGDDELRNRAGTDAALYANGGAGNDYLNGARGDDILIGGPGNDTIFGRDGIDRLFGQTGDDRLFGGGKRDVFVFTVGDGDDVIVDFQKGFDQVRFNGVTFADLTFTDFGSDQRIGTVNGDSVTLLGSTSSQPTLSSDDEDKIFGSRLPVALSRSRRGVTGRRPESGDGSKSPSCYRHLLQVRQRWD